MQQLSWQRSSALTKELGGNTDVSDKPFIKAMNAGLVIRSSAMNSLNACVNFMRCFELGSYGVMLSNASVSDPCQMLLRDTRAGVGVKISLRVLSQPSWPNHPILPHFISLCNIDIDNCYIHFHYNFIMTASLYVFFMVKFASTKTEWRWAWALWLDSVYTANCDADFKMCYDDLRTSGQHISVHTCLWTFVSTVSTPLAVRLHEGHARLLRESIARKVCLRNTG